MIYLRRLREYAITYETLWKSAEQYEKYGDWLTASHSGGIWDNIEEYARKKSKRWPAHKGPILGCLATLLTAVGGTIVGNICGQTLTEYLELEKIASAMIEIPATMLGTVVGVITPIPVFLAISNFNEHYIANTIRKYREECPCVPSNNKEEIIKLLQDKNYERLEYLLTKNK